jgi:stage V sporulation protein K
MSQRTVPRLIPRLNSISPGSIFARGVCILGFVKAMEDHKDELILILAGYQQEMENFLQTNPGLRSRFPIHIDFPDYNQHELLKIAEQMCAKRQYQLANEAKITLLKMLNLSSRAQEENFGNARTIRNMIEKAVRRQAVRLIAKDSSTREELMLIETRDFMEVKE